MNTVRIRMLGAFHIFVNNECIDAAVGKSKKGLALLQFLILQREAVVPNQMLIDALWSSEENSNPDNALKTLVSRFRVILNQCSPKLGSCIVAGRGGYRFSLLHGMTVDMYEFEECIRALEGAHELADQGEVIHQRVLEIYIGDLLQDDQQDEWASGIGACFHEQFIKSIYGYLSLLKEKGANERIVQICRLALETDPFDERLHLELMQALSKVDRNDEALMQYKHVADMHYRNHGEKPLEGIHGFYRHMIKADEILERSIESIRGELKASGDVRGAYMCEYSVFREIYSLQMRNLERFGASIYVAVIMITGIASEPIEEERLEEIMTVLGEVLVQHLRKGDTVSRFDSSQYALLLPSVNMETGRMVMERIKQIFYQKHPDLRIMFNYRVAPINMHAASGPYA